MLTGKGWFIWQVPRCEGGDPQAIAARAAEAGLSHVLIKIAERTHTFGFDRFGRDLVAPAAEALRARGVQVWGWHYVYGDNPTGEAATAVQRVRQLKLDGYVIDAEQEYKHPGKKVAARMFMNSLRQGLPHTPIALSSYRYPAYHAQIPWDVFLEQCDYAMPQVYWEQAHNPAQQLERSVSEFNDPKLVGSVRPIIPTGAAYGTGRWRASPEDIRTFLRRAQALQLPAANLYSWDYTNLPGNSDLWEAAARCGWPRPAPPADIVTRWAEALSSGQVERVLALYQPGAAHITPQRTRVGREALRSWYTDLLQARAPGAAFTAQVAEAEGTVRRFRWQAQGNGVLLHGEDILALREGQIEYHTTSLTTPPA